MLLTTYSWLLLASCVAAQTVAPSNNSADVGDPSSSPRFWLNATGSVQFPGFQIAPLDEYSNIRRSQFLSISFSGYIVNTDASNSNKIDPNDFNYVSCDPEDYEGGNLDATALLRIIANQPTSSRGDKSSLVFYSTRSSHCNASHLDALPQINGVFTTLDSVVAAQIKSRNFTFASNAIATLTPDQSSFVAYGGIGSTSSGHGSTTAVAMIILYAITGIITGLFICIIISGAVRAHRHPERYGPRNVQGRPRQGRAKGIARAMLETIPIVKFGDHHDVPANQSKDATKDVEMMAQDSSAKPQVEVVGDKNTASIATAVVASPNSDVSPRSKENADAINNADGSDDSGGLGCSICTEDFQKGEELRQLPCNHKFHPDCVDPWLLNVSGTCPLCRINLAPAAEQGSNETTPADGTIAPPLVSAAPFGDRRSQAIHNLMSIAYGSREERVTALRRYRIERRNRNSQVPNTENVEERASRARIFRDALRIRTRTHEPAAAVAETRDSGTNAPSGSQTRT